MGADNSVDSQLVIRLKSPDGRGGLVSGKAVKRAGMITQGGQGFLVPFDIIVD